MERFQNEIIFPKLDQDPQTFHDHVTAPLQHNRDIFIFNIPCMKVLLPLCFEIIRIAAK